MNLYIATNDPVSDELGRHKCRGEQQHIPIIAAKLTESEPNAARRISASRRFLVQIAPSVYCDSTLCIITHDPFGLVLA